MEIKKQAGAELCQAQIDQLKLATHRDGRDLKHIDRQCVFGPNFHLSLIPARIRILHHWILQFQQKSKPAIIFDPKTEKIWS